MEYKEGSPHGVCTLCMCVPQNGYIDAGPVDILCLDCAREIYETMKGLSIKTYICRECGEEFVNKGDFLAHCRYHKRAAESARGGEEA